MTRPRRTYNSPFRDEQSRLTRGRVIAAAYDLFLTSGYTGTTIDAIAGAAAVSVQTVYNTIGNKAAVLTAVYDATLAGDDAPIAIADRPTFQAVLEATSGRRCLDSYAALSRQLGERAAQLVATILAEAGNPDIRALAERAEGQRFDGTTTVARHLGRHFGLAPDITVDEAADILWTLTAPETMIRLVHRRRWNWSRYETWLADAMADGVLARRRSTRARP